MFNESYRLKLTDYMKNMFQNIHKIRESICKLSFLFHGLTNTLNNAVVIIWYFLN